MLEAHGKISGADATAAQNASGVIVLAAHANELLEGLAELRRGGIRHLERLQILPRLGLLPEGALVDNTSGRFTCRWVGLKNVAPENAFLRELPEEIEFPVAHAEGRFVAASGAAERYHEEGLVALSYTRDVNGSQCRIAGLQDITGRVFGLMPHPERFLFKYHHYDPDWNGDPEWGWGYYFFHSIYLQIAGLRGIDATADVGVPA